MLVIKNISDLNNFHLGYKSYKTIISAIEFGINSVDPALLIQEKVKKNTDDVVSIKGNFQNEKTISHSLNKFQNIYVIGAGKAAGKMASGLHNILRDHVTSGVIIVPYGQKIVIPKIKVIEANHPFPDNNSIRGSREILKLLYQNNSNYSLIFCLLSGGGSSLLSLPIDGINLEDKNKIIKDLMEKGSSINEINIIRKHLSKIKGGKLILGLEKYVKNYKMISLILSDVVGDKIDIIASGPTVPDPSNYSDAIKILKKYDLWESKNDHIVKIKNIFIKENRKKHKDQKKFYNVNNFLIGNNSTLCRNIKFFVNKKYIKNSQNVLWIKSPIREEAKTFANKLANFFFESTTNKKKQFFCIIGGESTVNLQNKVDNKIGLGGRNQEVAFRILQKLSQKHNLPDDFCIASIGSDGIDGNSPAAGGLITNTSISLLKQNKLNPNVFLKNHNTFCGLNAVKSTIITGLTGTNVNDVVLMCYYR